MEIFLLSLSFYIFPDQFKNTDDIYIKLAQKCANRRIQCFSLHPILHLHLHHYNLLMLLKFQTSKQKTNFAYITRNVSFFLPNSKIILHCDLNILRSFH